MLSRRTNTNLLTVRRWELAGWKPGATAANATLELKKGKLVNTGKHPNFTFNGSTVLFNGWEGARGPWDCEPLSAEVGSTAEVYVNKAQYWISH